ncbi:MAG TPA: MOSC domain-containing protein [Solirubrobacteraceae bacterium]|nr:MOSC domain-containing protein [Solirubrobacteraceae bacterium]
MATILELGIDELPRPRPNEDPATGFTVTRWLGSLGLGLVPVASPASFSWPGPWIARLGDPAREELHSVVMYGVPSGIVWDPEAGSDAPSKGRDQLASSIADGFLVAATDIALARPGQPSADATAGVVEQICIAPAAGEPVQLLESVRAIPGQGLDGDRHVLGRGTFPSGVPGSALTLIQAEVCESFDPPLRPDEHRRNLVTRGIDLNSLVGHTFSVGDVTCRGMRLCEPCTVVDRYGSRPLLRPLVHRGGLRADILTAGEIRSGDELRAAGLSRDSSGAQP